MYVKLSDTEMATRWLLQFKTLEDRVTAKELLDSLKYVSNREFENGIIQEICNLQKALNAPLAVYSVIDPLPPDIDGYRLFSGSFSINFPNKKRKKQHFGSENRLRHLVERLCEGVTGVQPLYSEPIYSQIKNQKIKNIVLVDDFSGSGRRIVKYLQSSLPKYMKRKISLGQVHLYIITYAITEKALKYIQKKINYFHKNSEHIITCISINSTYQLNPTVKHLCKKYNNQHLNTAHIGFQNSFGGIVFEHGCPNNLPEILWKKKRGWNPLFPRRFIPIELKPSFSEHSTNDQSKVLWCVGQQILANALHDAIEQKKIDSTTSLIISILGLKLKGIKHFKIPNILLIEKDRYKKIVDYMKDNGLLDNHKNVTQLGISLVDKIKENKKPTKVEIVYKNYYPKRCDGHFRPW